MSDINKVNRENLAEKFSDNETPTGSDFSQLIHSGINQLDDGILVEEDSIEVSKTLILKDLNENESADASSTISFISHDEINIADEMRLSSGAEGAFEVYDSFQIQKSGLVSIDLTDSSTQTLALDVIGNSQLEGNLLLEGELEVTQQANLMAGLEVTGHTHLVDKLFIEGESEFNDLVSIGGPKGSADALLNIQNKADEIRDLLRIEDTTEDSSPFIVKANGRVGINSEDPKNNLDVSGNVRIGSSALIDGLSNSLSVENRLGVGTASPTAVLDIHSSSENELLNIRKNDKTLVKIKVAENVGDTEIQLNSRTQVNDALTVTDVLTAASIDVIGALTAASSTISGKSETATLVVGPQMSIENGPESTAAATFNSDVNVKGLTSLQQTNVYGKLDAKTQLTAQRANVREKLSVGLADDSTVDAVLEVKGAGEDSSALLVRDHESQDIIRVKRDKVSIGGESHNVSLQVKGNTDTNCLTVSGLSSLADVSISDNLTVGETDHDISSTAAEHARFCLTSNKQRPKAIHVKYKETDLLSTYEHKIGFHCSIPEADFHVGAPSLFDEKASFVSGFDVKDAGSDAPSFSVTNTQVSLGNSLNSVPFDIFGDTNISGNLNVNSLVNVNENSLTLSQQADVTTFKIEQPDNTQYIHATAGKLAINTAISAYSFDLLGDAKIAGRLDIQQDDTNANALNVMGSAEISNQVTVNGETFLNDAVTINGPLTVNHSRHEGDNGNALNVTGHGVISQTLTVSDALTVNNGLNVTGDGIFNHDLFVTGATELTQSLDVSGKITAKDELHIQGNSLSELSMTVDKRADFRDNLLVSGDIGFSTLEPSARLHIHHTDASKASFKIDSVGEDDSSLIFNQGKLGIGIDDPTEALEVLGTTKIHQDLHVKRQTYLDNCLYVDQLATFSSNVKVHGFSELNGQTVIGDLNCPDNDAARSAQLCLFQNNYDSAFKIMFSNESPVVFSRGKLGIGTDNPQVELDVKGKADIEGSLFVKDSVEIRGKVTQLQGADVWGDVVFHSDFTVGDNTLLQDTLDVLGKTTLKNTLEVTKCGHFLSTLDVADNVVFNANLDVNQNTNIKGDLTLSSTDANVTLHPATSIENTLTVQKSCLLKGKVQIDDALVIGLDKQETQARLHITADSQAPAFTVDIDKNENVEVTRALTLSADGKLGLNCSAPMATLDVKGNANIEHELNVQNIIVNENITFKDSAVITGVSSDTTLGGGTSSDTILPTQAAVKAYIDEASLNFGNGGNTCLIHCQSEFDAVFNRGDNTQIVDNTTILLFPFVSQSAIHRQYILKNSVKLGSGVRITGFNEKTTCIIKDTATCRFSIKGDNQNAYVEDIKLSGFTFDGANYLYPASGGAFELKYARNIQLNCHIVNHKSVDNGGALYGEMEYGNQTAINIEALNISYCSAENNAGGGAYGLAFSHIRAKNCIAKFGGAVACCDESKVDASDNIALLSGGGAYFCNSLFCDGFWKGNHAPEGKNVYANNCQHGADIHVSDERYYWHGVYLDTPLLGHNDFWRTDNL